MGAAAWLMSTVKRHPWSVTQDTLALLLVMIGGVLLAFQYELVEFWDDFSSNEKRIRVEEAFLLTILLAVGLAIFMARRFKEARLDVERAARADAANALALLDPLTELPNRRALEVELATAIEAPPIGGQMHAFYLLDLNGFKRVNDENGHAAGDEVLRIVAKRFRTAARQTDVVARLGGDEFAVLACNIDSRDMVAQIGNRFVTALGDEVSIGDQAFPVGVAVGVALYPDNGATLHEVTQRADQAMYKAKALRRSNLQFYHAD